MGRTLNTNEGLVVTFDLGEPAIKGGFEDGEWVKCEAEVCRIGDQLMFRHYSVHSIGDPRPGLNMKIIYD